MNDFNNNNNNNNKNSLKNLQNSGNMTNFSNNIALQSFKENDKLAILNKYKIPNKSKK